MTLPGSPRRKMKTNFRGKTYIDQFNVKESAYIYQICNFVPSQLFRGERDELRVFMKFRSCYFPQVDCRYQIHSHFISSRQFLFFPFSLSRQMRIYGTRSLCSYCWKKCYFIAFWAKLPFSKQLNFSRLDTEKQLIKV